MLCCWLPRLMMAFSSASAPPFCCCAPCPLLCLPSCVFHSLPLYSWPPLFHWVQWLGKGTDSVQVGASLDSSSSATVIYEGLSRWIKLQGLGTVGGIHPPSLGWSAEVVNPSLSESSVWRQQLIIRKNKTNRPRVTQIREEGQGVCCLHGTLGSHAPGPERC